jgi:hypothetical protein
LDYAEHDRLKEALRIVHEKARMNTGCIKERERIVANQPLKLGRFEEVVQRTERRREEPRVNYPRHIEEHCRAVIGATRADMPEDLFSCKRQTKCRVDG